jgi:hypothetical protein
MRRRWGSPRRPCARQHGAAARGPRPRRHDKDRRLRVPVLDRGLRRHRRRAGPCRRLPPTATHPYAAAKRAGRCWCLPPPFRPLPRACGAAGIPLRPGRGRAAHTGQCLARRALVRGGGAGRGAGGPRRRSPPRLDLGARPCARAPAPDRCRPGEPPAAPDLGPCAVGRGPRAADRPRNPGTTLRSGPALGAKPPAVPSAIPALDGFRWTAPEDGLAALMSERTAA